MKITDINKMVKAVEEFTDATFGNEDWRTMPRKEYDALMEAQESVNSLKWKLQKLGKIISERT
jgi:hypothetical protein